ncbi:Crp/Fnr family transcriptional regulator [Pontibacillus yanchengensis]|uniref:Crp/Fnr family transcriptional regulator n=1 Tax=Pontibacillus yanchengensis Y32 TaxID=1385514 RepID=A0A0A2T683_9BACI|nr:Crp/Fnr family transcriptional regulator [Pontibacillus yanchengensis]KGP71009.1 Crp/Fnr family transcriptional regulator [Pontibacillus yanchengensis Y32]
MAPSSKTLSNDLTELLSTVNHHTYVPKGTFLFQEGQLANELYIVKSGRIQISKNTPEGKELTLRICGINEIVGELTLFSEGAKYLLSAKAIESSEVGVIKKDELEEKLSHNNALAIEFMKWMSDHFRRTQTKFRDLILYGKKGALYSTLIRMVNSYGVEKANGFLIDMRLTNQELAGFCGTSREVVNRLLSDLKKEGIVSIQKGKITIHNLDYLRDVIGCENCPIDICEID